MHNKTFKIYILHFSIAYLTSKGQHNTLSPHTHTHTRTHTQGSNESVYFLGYEFAFPQSRVLIFMQIKFALTFSGSFTLSKSCFLNVGKKRKVHTTIPNMIPDIQLEAEVFFLRWQSHKGIFIC